MIADAFVRHSSEKSITIRSLSQTPHGWESWCLLKIDSGIHSFLWMSGAFLCRHAAGGRITICAWHDKYLETGCKYTSSVRRLSLLSLYVTSTRFKVRVARQYHTRILVAVQSTTTAVCKVMTAYATVPPINPGTTVDSTRIIYHSVPK